MDWKTVSRWGQRIPLDMMFQRTPLRVYYVTAGVLVGLMFVSLLVYAVTVFYENKIVDLGRETRDLHEDNQDLQIKLDRLRSYQKVAEASEKIHGLKVATHVMDVVERQWRIHFLSQAPTQTLSKETYGY